MLIKLQIDNYSSFLSVECDVDNPLFEIKGMNCANSLSEQRFSVDDHVVFYRTNLCVRDLQSCQIDLKWDI